CFSHSDPSRLRLELSLDRRSQEITLTESLHLVSKMITGERNQLPRSTI
ncbi:hypothetical protein LINGRAHAP2_LOCUS32636, partial [Linum grandiflorum]